MIKAEKWEKINLLKDGGAIRTNCFSKAMNTGSYQN